MVCTKTAFKNAVLSKKTIAPDCQYSISAIDPSNKVKLYKKEKELVRNIFWAKYYCVIARESTFIITM